MKPHYRLQLDGSFRLTAYEWFDIKRVTPTPAVAPIRARRKTRNDGLRREEIKAAMLMAGISPAMLCDELKVAASSVSQTISGHIRSKRIQTRIAEIVGKPIKTIWPNQVVLRRSRAQIEAAQSAKAAA